MAESASDSDSDDCVTSGAMKWKMIVMRGGDAVEQVGACSTGKDRDGVNGLLDSAEFSYLRQETGEYNEVARAEANAYDAKCTADVGWMSDAVEAEVAKGLKSTLRLYADGAKVLPTRSFP